MPEVKGEFFRYKKEDFHCSDINQIKVSRIRIITVYLSNGKKIRITRDYENYETFLVWAEKCGIDIDRAVDYGDDVEHLIPFLFRNGLQNLEKRFLRIW